MITEKTCTPKIKAVIYVRKGKAKNNLLKHIDTNDVEAIKQQIKRGSVIIIK